ncbi:hypothetical protein KCU99_g54, partial [Aureobasidium melanogenum]
MYIEGRTNRSVVGDDHLRQAITRSIGAGKVRGADKKRILRREKSGRFLHLRLHLLLSTFGQACRHLTPCTIRPPRVPKSKGTVVFGNRGVSTEKQRLVDSLRTLRGGCVWTKPLVGLEFD